MKTERQSEREFFMEEAIIEAEKGFFAKEVPVGCVIVRNGIIIARAHNETERTGRTSAHAEMLALDRAQAVMQEKFLTGCEMYVTAEPCAMCAGGIVNARIGTLYIGVTEPKTGCCGSLYNLVEDTRFNHRTAVYKGIKEERCRSLMKNFFEERRTEC